MDHKPLITYFGDINVFQAVVPSLQKNVGAEALEWRRPFGRSAKNVHLHPRFIPFNYESQSQQHHEEGGDINNYRQNEPASQNINSLLDTPMMHTYWLECSDVEVYKSSIKDSIQSWLSYIKSSYRVKEWLIILVEPADNKKANKLLPRSSVLDKIKNDFAQKQTERCVCLSDPNKIDSKSAESLASMLHRLRQLLLASYSKVLTKFEENMRAQREKRNELGWNFCHYFLLQEELAYVLEMLGVYDEALVQYDELDALFTQFVLNSYVQDTPKWLLSFQRYSDRWPALNLNLSLKSNQILSKIRDTILDSSVSLLNFRNYLFARQASLLIKQGKMNELANRSLAFLHNSVKELGILDVKFSEDGATECWTFVSCLEILDTICGNNSMGLMNDTVSNHFGSNNQQQQSILQPLTLTSSDFSVHTAGLWDYAREKLYDLGKLCDLLPQSKVKPDHLHKVINLAGGLLFFDDIDLDNNKENGNNPIVHPEKENNANSDNSETPIEKLKNALSNKECFEKNYLEYAMLAMGTYKHIGRLRCARKVGICLSEYYMDAGEFTKAIGFLSDALKTFRDDKWQFLLIQVLIKLAICYKSINDTERYIRTCAQLACHRSAQSDVKNNYFNELMKYLDNNEEEIISPMEDIFDFENLTSETEGKINIDSCQVVVKFRLRSYLPKSIDNVTVQVALLPCEPANEKHLEMFNNSTSISVTTFPNYPGQQGSAGGGNSSGSKKQLKNSSSNASNKKGKESGDNNQNQHSSAAPTLSAPSAFNLNLNTMAGRKESLYTNPLTCQEEDINMILSELHTQHGSRLDLTQQLELKQVDKSVQAGRLLCNNSHKALRRKESSHVQGDVQISKTDFIQSAQVSNITINPGADNLIVLQSKISNQGHYRLGQISLKVNNFELLSPRLGCRYKFIVDKIPGKIELITNSGSENLILVAGIEQKVFLVLYTGSNCISQGMKLNIRSSFGLLLKSHKNSPLSTELSLELPFTSSFSSTTIDLIVKSEFGPQKDSSTIEHRLITKCLWTDEEFKIPIQFNPPFMSSYKLSSVETRKFVQINLQGLSEQKLTFTNHQLVINQQNDINKQDIPLVPLNSRSQSLKLNKNLIASYLWEIGVNEVNDEENQLRLEFSVTFESEHHDPELYKYYICFQKFKTQVEVKSKVEPHKGSEFCRVGSMSSMTIEIGKIKDSETPLMVSYEVRADQHLWAICGRTSGVISIEGSKAQSVVLDVMPMSPGFLPLPVVHLSKYIPAEGGSSKLEPFATGQIFNRSRSSQVHVLPQQQQQQLIVGSAGGGVAQNSI